MARTYVSLLLWVLPSLLPTLAGADTIANSQEDPVLIWCTEHNGPNPSSVNTCITESRKQGPALAKQLGETLRREKEQRDARQRQWAAVRDRMQRDVQHGYLYMTIHDYAYNANRLAGGKKVAVPGQFRDINLLSDAPKLNQASLVIDSATPASRQRFLTCLKAVNVMGAPCPLVVLGTIDHCPKKTFGIEDGTVPCIVVDDAWGLSDIGDVWTMDEVWKITPIES